MSKLRPPRIFGLYFILFLGSCLFIGNFNLPYAIHASEFEQKRLIDQKNNFNPFLNLNFNPNNTVHTIALDSIHNKVFFQNDYDLGGGLAIYDLNTDTFTIRTVDDGVASKSLGSMVFNANYSTLYIGTNKGLNIYNLATDSFSLRTNSDGLIDPQISKLWMDKLNNILYIWAGGESCMGGFCIPYGGLSIYDITTDSFTNQYYVDGPITYPTGAWGDGTHPTELLSQYASSAFDDANGILYRSYDGLVIHDLVTDTIIKRTESDGLVSNDIIDLELDANNRLLYIGTYYGLCIYDIKSDSFTTITVTNGLLSNYIRNLSLDTKNNILGIGVRGGVSLYYIDFDKDGLTNIDESEVYGSDPSLIDTDGDSLHDYDEIFMYDTNPNLLDTDKDELSDDDEIIIYHTKPNVLDTDRDGLTDGEEVLSYHSQPLIADTDFDGILDGIEIQQGSDPLQFNVVAEFSIKQISLFLMTLIYCILLWLRKKPKLRYYH